MSWLFVLYRNVIRHLADPAEESTGGREEQRPEESPSQQPPPQPQQPTGSSRRKPSRVGYIEQQQAVRLPAEEDVTGGGAGWFSSQQPVAGRRIANPSAAMSTKSMGGGGERGGGGGERGSHPSSGRSDPDGQQYCLRWNNHRSNLLTVFEQLLQTEAFTDVTLAVGGTSIKCHKMVLAACSSYFQSLFLDNAHPHPIVVFKDIAYAEIRAILEYMYRGEVNVAQEQLPSLLKVAEALRVKGLFEDDSLNNTATSSVGDRLDRSEREPPALSTIRTHSSQHQQQQQQQQQQAHRSKSPSPTQQPDSYQQQRSHASSSYYNKSPLPSPQGSESNQRDGRNDTNSSSLNMWPPLVMPLHLGAFESALREREQALALYGAIQRGGEDSGAASGNGHNNNADLPSGGSSGSSNGATNKRKRLSSSHPPPEVDSAPLLRTVLGPKGGHHHQHHHGDIPGLFPFRLGSGGSASAGAATGSDGSGAPADERSHLGYLPMAMAYAEVRCCMYPLLLTRSRTWRVLRNMTSPATVCK